MEEFNSFLSKYHAEQEQSKAKGKEYLLSLIPQLKTAGVGYLVGFFEGSGDSGQIEAVNFYPPNTEDVEDVRGTWDAPDGMTVGSEFDMEQIEGAVDSITPPGFEINEGGFGAVILDVEAGKVKLNYSYRVEESVEDDREL